MKIYWRDREGRPAPFGATFQCIPFFPKASSPFSRVHEQIDSLPAPASAKVLKREFLPAKTEWISAVQSALAKKMEKVVLARCEVLELAEKPDPFALTAALQEKAENAYLFCFSEGDTAFLGASPERLFRRSKNLLETEAVAGTSPIGCDQLLRCEKALRELLPVQAFFQRVLPPPLVFSPISLLKTKYVQHLYMRCSAYTEISDADILSRIHPTPALCGTPTEEAMALIRKLEPFDRGLYGGALGWSTPEESEWIVGIRCCFIQGKRAYLYTGAGIVEGSDPEEEWEELNQKKRLYDGIFV